ncbi:MAG: DUF3048 domain-containing protein [Acidimicrobiales bacterium]
MRRLTALAAAAMVLAACSSRAKPEAIAPPPTTVPRVYYAPLTGLQVAGPEIVERPAVTIKVDNAPQARPQAGIERADVVIEERVEGGFVRFLAVFHSTDAETVGPIRSVRSTDVPVVSPLGGVFVYSGGIAKFVEQVRLAPITAIAEDDGIAAFDLRRDKARPFKTYSSTARLRSYAKTGSTAPPPLFEFPAPGAAPAPSGALPATKATAVFAGQTTTAWDYDAATARWLRSTNRTAHTVEGGARLSATNVILQFVDYRDTGQRDSRGAVVDEAMVVGTGEAWLLSGASAVKGRWSKPSASAVTRYTDAAGAPLLVAPGQSWVSLLPTGAAATIS